MDPNKRKCNHDIQVQPDITQELNGNHRWELLRLRKSSE